jgi:hypothetical protein
MIAGFKEGSYEFSEQVHVEMTVQIAMNQTRVLVFYSPR